MMNPRTWLCLEQPQSQQRVKARLMPPGLRPAILLDVPTPAIKPCSTAPLEAKQEHTVWMELQEKGQQQGPEIRIQIQL